MIGRLYLLVFVLVALTYGGAQGQKDGTCVRKKQCGMGQGGGIPAATNAPTAPPTNAPTAPPTNAPTAPPTTTPPANTLSSNSDVLKKEVPAWPFGSEVVEPDKAVNIAAEMKFTDGNTDLMPVADGLPLFKGNRSAELPGSMLPCFYSPSSCIDEDGYSIVFWTRNNDPENQMYLLRTGGEKVKKEGITVTNRGKYFWISTDLLKNRFYMYTRYFSDIDPKDWFLITITVSPDGTSFYYNNYKLGGKSDRKSRAYNSPNEGNKISLNAMIPPDPYSFEPPADPTSAQIQIGNIYEFDKILDEKAVKSLYAAGPYAI